MYRPISAALLALGIICVAGNTAAAVDIMARTVPSKPSAVMVGTNSNDPAPAIYDAPPPPAHSKIFSNFAKYSKGKFVCCFGFSLSGGATTHQWLAVPFKPATNTTAKTIEVAISNISGTNAAVITLNSDAGGIPGTALATFHVSTLPSFGATGTCCTITTVTSASGVALTGGHTYWVVVMTDAASATFKGIWHANEINQISSQSGAVSQSGTTWGTTVFKPGLAFGVFGP
ncbi:MAG TPA: choice-of-anchor R domain-containing protein [Rhizomicrobium sp.]